MEINDNNKYNKYFVKFYESSKKMEKNGNKYLHFASHSHHPWMDISYEGQMEYWNDSNTLLDEKWDKIFGKVLPDAKNLINRILKIENSDYNNIVFGQNTYELILRIFSGILPNKIKNLQKINILSSTGEYHSFNRLVKSLQEQYPSLINICYVSSTDIDNFHTNLINQVRNQNFDIIFFSHVFFKTGLINNNLNQIINDIRLISPKEKTQIIIDGYHAFCAIPINLNSIKEEIFYLGGGYKYAMSGENVCFAHCPKQSLEMKPIFSGWMSNFAGLSDFNFQSKIDFDKGSNPFVGSTFDSTGIYRFNKTWELCFSDPDNLSIEVIHNFIKKMQEIFIDKLDNFNHNIFNSKNLIGSKKDVGNYLAFKLPDSNSAEYIKKKLFDEYNIQVDNRQEILRIGFGIYHSVNDLDKLIDSLLKIEF